MIKTQNYILFYLLISPACLFAQTCQTINVPATSPNSQFMVNADGTVKDINTGLMWKRCSEGKTWNGNICTGNANVYTWQAALQQAQAVNLSGFAGYHDWRVPNIKELRSIIEKQCYSPSINLNVFSNLDSARFWSSSPGNYNGLNAWQVNFDYGDDSYGFKQNTGEIQLVRDTN